MDGNALALKVASALRKVGPMTRTSLKRVVTQAGGDTSIGRPGAIVTSDTVFDPQPFFDFVSDREVLYSNDKMISDGDYKFTFTGSSVTVADFQDPNAILVLRDAQGAEEILQIIYCKPASFKGVDVALYVYARSVKR